jgi:hypothetical protein
MPAKLKGNIVLSKGHKMTKDNAQSLLSYILYINGYTRLNHAPGVKSIVSSRDIRYHPSEISFVDRNTPPKNTDTYDYQMIVYEFKNLKAGTKFIARAFRPFMSRYGRIIDTGDQGSQRIVIQDTGKNIGRLYKMLKAWDVKMTSEQLKEYEDNKEFRRTLQLEKAKNCNKIDVDVESIKKVMK